MSSLPTPKHLLGAVLVALALALPAAGQAAAPAKTAGKAAPATAKDPVVAKIDGKVVHRSELEEEQQEAGPQAMKIPFDKIYLQLLNHRLQIILVSDAAKAQKLQNDPEVKQAMARIEDQVLAQVFIRRVAEKAATEQAVHAAYEKMVKSEAGEEEVRARHILVGTEAEAKAIIAQLEKGADFAKLANAKSTDKSEGGELGWFRKEDMVPEFADAAFKLKKGEYTKTPVKTKFGWHVIQVEDRRIAKPKTFDEVKDELRQEIGQQAAENEIKALRDKAKIEVFNPDGTPVDDAPAPAKKP